MLNTLLHPDTIARAYQWLCQTRKHHPPNADIWHFRFHWRKEITQIKQQIVDKKYLFSALQLINKADGSQVAVWSSRDALVLKMFTLTLQDILPCHKLCTHFKGHGGAKQSVQTTHDRINSGQYGYVIRTDIKGYYANIQKRPLIDQLAQHIHCPIILNLMSQYLHYSVENGGNFHTPTKGISRGCPLSPLMAGFQLYEVDHYFGKQKRLRYTRYMDDFLILCSTRWQCRRAVKALNQFFDAFGFKQHPNKTQIGKITKGFDWLGYQFNEAGILHASSRTLTNHSNTLHRLYEQARRSKQPPDAIERRVAKYRIRWQRWLQSGLTTTLPKKTSDYDIGCVRAIDAGNAAK